MPQIPFDDFIRFARTQQGKIIRTRAGRSTFTVEVTDRGLVFVPASLGASQHTINYREEFSGCQPNSSPTLRIEVSAYSSPDA